MPSRWLDKIVLYEKLTMERMADVHAVVAQVAAAADPKKASDAVMKYMDYLFPEVAGKELSMADKMKQLEAFTSKTLMLEVGDLGLKLKVEEKK
jgi:hypothetical protein